MGVSVVIPTLNEAANIDACIAAARNGYRAGQVEIIVSDGGSTDNTCDHLPPDVALVRSPRGRGIQMNRGAAIAHGDVLVFCHADVRLPHGWYEAMLTALDRPGVSGGAFQIAYHPPQGILHLINRIKFPENWRGIHGDRAQFMRRATFTAIGGFPEIPLMEDVEMARALSARGRMVLVPLRVTASSRRYLDRGPLRQFLSSIWNMVRYLYFGASPEEIAHVYRSSREEKMRS